MTAARKNARGEAARSRILASAVACLGDGGIDAVRIARVARGAGVSTALVHYHFATREALLAQALEASYAIAGDARAVTKYGSGPARVRLRRKVEASLPTPGAQRREWELWVELWLRATRDRGLRAAAAAVYGRLHDSLRELIEDGTAKGEFAVADPAATADRILALIDGFGVRALLGDPRMPIERAREATLEELERELDVHQAREAASQAGTGR